MKRLLQLVALFSAALLATQPALAGVLCASAGASQPMDMQGCYGTSSATTDASDQARLQHAQDMAAAIPGAYCSQGCCTVSPQSAPVPIANEKATVENVQQWIALAAPVLVPSAEMRGKKCPHHEMAATPRQELLQVFRI